MALSGPRSTPEAIGDVESYPVLAATTIYAGALVVLDGDGYARPGTAAAGLVAVGRAEETIVNGGASGAARIDVRKGVFGFRSGTDADTVGIAHVGDNAYVIDDETVGVVATSRSIAGRIEAVRDGLVWVRMGSAPLSAPGGALLAAANLGDVGTAATALANLGGSPGLTATVTVGEQVSTTITVSVQLKDPAGVDLAVRGAVLAYLSDDEHGDSVAATAPDSVAAGTDGVAIPLDAGKTFLLVSEADGDIDLAVTEDGEDTFFLVLVLPGGRLVVSEAITFAT